MVGTKKCFHVDNTPRFQVVHDYTGTFFGNPFIQLYKGRDDVVSCHMRESIVLWLLFYCISLFNDANMLSKIYDNIIKYILQQ